MDSGPSITLTVDGRERRVEVDTRTTLLDALRERLGNTSPKKGCDHGQCGSCTVLLDGRRHLTCLALALSYDGAEVVTAAGLGAVGGSPGELHPVQQAFLEHDGLQCGYCTPGQIMSAVALLKEGHTGSDDEIREWMSGNLCRCGAYPNILAAIRAASSKSAAR